MKIFFNHISLAQAATPAMAGKGTAVLVFFGVATTTFLVGWQQRNRLIGWSREKPAFRTLLQFGEPVLAILLTIFAGLFALWRSETWTVVSSNLLIGTALESTIFCVYVGIKVVTSEAKDRDHAKMVTFDSSIAKLQDEVNLQTRRAKAWQYRQESCLVIVLNARKVVGEKLKRIVNLLEIGGPVSFPDLVKAMSPEDQIRLLLGCIYAYFAKHMEADKTLDLRIYMRDKSDTNQLICVFAFNGQTSDYAKNRSKAYHRLDGVGGAPSQVAERWTNREEIRIIESCEDANRDGSFSYLQPRQRGECCSMVTLRHVIQGDLNTAMVLSMACSQDRLFKIADRERIRHFLSETLHRLGCEWALLSAIQRLSRQ